MDQANKKSLILSLGVFLILLATLPIIVYQVQKPQEIRTRAQISEVRQDNAALIASSNTKLLQLNVQHGKAKIASEKDPIFQEMDQISLGRKNRMLALMEENPEQANQIALSEGQRLSLPRAIRDKVEKKIEVEGELTILHQDDFEKGKGVFKIALRAADGKDYNLFLPDVSLPLASRAKVKIKGIAFDQSIAAATQEEGGVVLLSQATLQAPISKNAVVILANFLNDTSQPWTVAQVNDVVFNQTSSYYNENSFGKLGLSGDVFGWYTLQINKTCDLGSIKNAAIQTSDPDIFFPNYTNIIIVVPVDPFVCGWSGAALIGDALNNTADGSFYAGNAWIATMTSRIVGHELGHNWMAWHANFVNCGTSTLSGACTNQGYDDLFEIMGRNLAHMNGYHKDLLGFFDPANVLNVTSSGSYTISPIETISSGPQMLKIDRGNGQFFFIEYRQPLGVDSVFSASVFDGAMIHFAPGISNNGDTHLLDMTPTSPRSHSDVTLQVGQSFTGTDVLIGSDFVTITVTGQTATSLTLDIAFIPPTVDVKVNSVQGPISLTAPATYVVDWISGSSNCTKSGSWSGTGGSIGSEPFNDVLTAGIYTYTVTCTNPGGSTSDSATVNILSPTQPPIIDVRANWSDGPLTLSEPADIFVDWSASYATNGCTNSGSWTGFAYSSYNEFFFGKPQGTYTYNVTCSNDLGTTSDSVTVDVVTAAPTPTPLPPTPTPTFTPTPTPPPSDTTSPTVSITNPLNGSTVFRNSKVTITASASDNIGVTKVEFLVNGSIKCTDTTSSYSCSWKVPGARNRTYTLTAKAYDVAGNTANHNINVTSN